VDKLTIAAMEATVAIYLRGELNEIPTLRMIQISPAELGRRATSLAGRIAQQPGMTAQVREGESVVGGGSTPGQSLPTRLIAVSHSRLSADDLENELRRNVPPVIARVERDQVILDLRTVLLDQEEEVVEALARVTRKHAGTGRGVGQES
jgi:L-seryl-tRNA(Ser) seleniumtransferase